MKNSIKILALGLLFITSQNTFAQNVDEKVKSGNLALKADNIKIDNKTNVVVYEGNVSLSSDNVTFDCADKIVFDTNQQKMEIYKPQNFKFISMKTLMLKNQDKPNFDFVTFYTKEGRLEL
ncbi:LptA/OstA family protein [Chryseobacterium gotjawalense]|uniref:LptA/OstA family protein n=1 Tax=Chryseobacterium gotjawalense TaxID=3042315 RepID=A0ABY8RGT0_9FLAO|nr:LptA/OstA family protein [Chryseobacterium sp. wdc7]WHF52407.1 LptA/OstA family protein [Chryseobacterium sp. wdc7]